MTTALKLANTFLARHAGGFGLQHMKLQKLCYYAYGWWLSAYEEPLTDKGPEVWKYGPVFSDLYDDLKTWGNAAIVAPQTGHTFNQAAPVTDNPEHHGLVDWIWRHYGKYTAIQLSEMTHAPGTPWRQLAERHNYKVPMHLQIPVELMREYFRSDAAKRELST